jgi:predicted small lipoprotein YifL
MGFAAVAVFAFLVVTACGKKGPPLPPLVRLPAAPADVVAERRGNTVDLKFTVPSTNTDGTRPANVSRAEVYAITIAASTAPLTDDQIVKLGTRVGTVPVKAPRDPDLTAEPDAPDDEVDPPEGNGLDQGAIARIAEPLTREMLTTVQIPSDPRTPTGSGARSDAPRPLLGPPPAMPSRIYATLGISTRGRKGPLSRRIVVPLVPPPPPPSAPAITYTESTVTVTWPPVGARAASAEAGEVAVLPSRPIGAAPPVMAYNVYDATTPDAPFRLTATPVAGTTFADARIVWGLKRCYTVRTAEAINGATIESDASPATCETLVDTFPPAAPKGITAIASEGAINLIWEPNAEKDLGGYVVWRGISPTDELTAITPAPIQDTSFKDAVQPGLSFVYMVKAVDKAGNVSPPSARVVESAR